MRNSTWTESGMTIIETLVAILILGLTATAVVSGVVTADRIAGRRTGLSYATLLAKNEAEKLRNCETSLTLAGDTAYTANVNGVEFDVSRTRIADSLGVNDSASSFGEYQISVTRKNVPSQAVSFRLLQGYYGQR